MVGADGMAVRPGAKMASEGIGDALRESIENEIAHDHLHGDTVASVRNATDRNGRSCPRF